MKHPILRTSGIPYEDFLIELEKLGRRIISCLPKEFIAEFGEPVDLELCGGYANHYAGLHSDLDLALPMKDGVSQAALWIVTNRLDTHLKIHDLLTEFDQTWGIRRTDFGTGVHNNKTSCVSSTPPFAIYSVFERKLYGTPLDGERWWIGYDKEKKCYVPKKYFNGDKEVETFSETPYAKTKMAWSRDEWPVEEVEKWRSYYGKDFQEYREEVLPDGTTQLTEL
jgi:hypothetical protein